jgi:uncharacterized repeat protein (TIGR01451 family)
MFKSAPAVLQRWPGWARLIVATVLLSGIVISVNTNMALLAPGDVNFTKYFIPDTIGLGSTTTLQFNITNVSGSLVTGLTFTDTLPSEIKLAAPAVALTTCADGLVSAPDGGSTITLSEGRIGPGASCSVTVNVTSNVAGTHTSVSGDLISSAGNHGTASDDLNVETDRPGFTKSFTPSTVPLGGKSTLEFLIDNTANSSPMANLTFADTLPTGMVVADPANASSACLGAVTADPGTDLVSHSGGIVNTGETCTVTVDVVATGVGSLGNVSGELTSSYLTLYGSGKASAVLEVERVPFLLTKSFTDDPVPPGGTATLEFTITSYNRSDAATNVTFSDDLDAALPGLAATGLPTSDVCGAGSQLAGTDTITLTGGTIPPEGTCTFSVELQVPAGAAYGVYTNTTSSITGDVGGSGETSGPATDYLTVSGAPELTKRFTDDPVAPGGTATLEFTISNPSPISTTTNIAFSDDLNAILARLSAVGLPANDVCGTGSQLSGTTNLSFTGGTLAPDSSCTFSVSLLVPVGAPGGIHTNTTSNVTAVVDGEAVAGGHGFDEFVVVGAPTLRKDFSPDVLAPGDTIILEFTLLHDEWAPGDATDISFTDDLETTLPGLVATGLPASDVCGTGSQLTGTDAITLTGATLSPGASCQFTVTLQVPPSALPGTYPNTTSNVTATVSGLTAIGSPASDDLEIAGVILEKSFIDDPVIPGDTVTLAFTVTNYSSSYSATSIFFSDNLGSMLSGLVATDLPKDDVCGTGSSFTSAGQLLVFSGGTVAPGASCTFSTVLQVPGGTTSNTYGNVTTGFQATVNGSVVYPPDASDILAVNDHWLVLSKSFIDDPVAPGGTTTLEFTIENTHPTQAVADFAFTDNLGVTLSGLTATGLPASDVCGAGSQLSGTTDLSLTGGSLAPGASCTFNVTLQVPVGAESGIYNNSTSEVTGSIGGLGVKGFPAEDALKVTSLTFTKAFLNSTVAGGTVTLEFTIENPSSTTSASDINFSDDLDAVLSGLVATGLPIGDVCGTGSEFSGTSVLNLRGGFLEPGESCTFSVTLQVPGSASPGSFVNTTSSLFSSGSLIGAPATASLQIEPPPAFSKSFAPDLVVQDGVSTLSFAIDNSASALAASSLDFSDNLPAGMVVATPPNASTTCTGGTLTAVAGSSTINYTGGAVAAGAICAVQVDVTPVSGGVLVNITGDLTSSSGNSGPASATLSTYPSADLAITKNDSHDPVFPGSALTYTVVIVNNGPHAATGIVVTDTLPAEFTHLGNTCGGSGTPLVWTIGALSSGSSYTCTITGTVGTGFSSSISNVATVSSDTSDPQPANNTVSETTAVLGYKAYLPVTTFSSSKGPDLVIRNISITSDDIQVVIENAGDISVSTEFWVDVYIDPVPPPTTVNQIWSDLADEGIVWGVTATALPLAPGETLTLTVGDAYYVPEYSHVSWPLATGTQVYAQVDSWDSSTTYGSVRESHEVAGEPYNNIFGPVDAVADGATLPAEPMATALHSTSSSRRTRRKYQ